MAIRYRAVFFDLDGTLISERAGVAEARAAVAAALRAQGRAVSDAAYAAAAQRVIDLAIAANGGSWPASFSRLDAIAATLRALSLEEAEAPALADLYKAERLAGLALLPGAREAVDAVGAVRPLGLISNGPSREQRQKLVLAGLSACFAAVVVSGEVGVAKPDAAIFERALAALGVQAGESVYVGNNYALDVEGARAAGLDAIWLDERGAGPPAGARTPPTATVRSMAGLADALGSAG